MEYISKKVAAYGQFVLVFVYQISSLKSYFNRAKCIQSYTFYAFCKQLVQIKVAITLYLRLQKKKQIFRCLLWT